MPKDEFFLQMLIEEKKKNIENITFRSQINNCKSNKIKLLKIIEYGSLGVITHLKK